MFMGLFAMIDATSTSNPATSSMLQMFVFPMTWILVALVIGFILYAFLGTMVKMAKTYGIRIQDWWYDGRF